MLESPPGALNPVPWGSTTIVYGGDTGWFRPGAWGWRLLRHFGLSTLTDRSET